MKTTILTTAAIALAVLATLQPPGIARADDAATGTPIKSTRAHGVIALAPDKSLTNGRLMMRVVAYNGGTDSVLLTPGSIHVTTAAGAAVALVPVEQLIKEVQDGNKPKATRGLTSSDVMPNRFGQDTGSAMRDSTGNVVHGVNGGVNTSAGDQVPYAAPAREAAPSKQTKESAAKVQQQIADLKAGILQTLTVAPRAAVGAQIVTDKLNFGPAEDRVLHVTVDFNGEQHELTVPVPAES